MHDCYARPALSVTRITRFLFVVLSIALCLPALANASPSSPRASTSDGFYGFLSNLSLDSALHFSRIEQQAKVEVGAARGERLVEETELAALLVLSYPVLPYLGLGLFAQADLGTRRAGTLAGFDEDGAATLDNESGGSFRELWVGPSVRGSYRWAFAELGYGLLTRRKDKGREDLPDEGGNTSTAFRTLPTVSWSFTAGASFPVSQSLEVQARMVWRIRYYNRRGASSLAGSVVHGTQSYQPFFGLRWTPRL